MPPRRSHKKSRNGCDQCKLRRVKCDETGPPCANCRIRQIDCIYSGAAKDSRQHAQGSEESPSALLNVETPLAITYDLDSPGQSVSHRRLTAGDRNLELELMHLYSTKTYATFCHQHGQDLVRRERERMLLQEFLPSQALKHDFALHALLAVAALHLSTLSDPSKSKMCLNVALEYQNSSHMLFRDALANLNEENCHAVMSCSLAYFVLGLTGPQMFEPCGNELKTVRENILSVFKLYKGAINIMSLFPHQLLKGPFGSFFSFFAPKNMSAYPECDAGTKHALEQLRAISESKLSAGKINIRNHNRNAHLITQLESVSRRVRGGVPTAVFGWLETLPESMITELETSQSMATLLLMHWAVLLDVPTDLWWSLSSGKALIAELCSSFSSPDPGEQEAIDWCRAQVGLDPKNWKVI